MRTLYLFTMISLDGYMEGKNHDLSWHHVDAEFSSFAIDQLHQTDTLIFGHRTYDLMASFWPREEALHDDPITAELMNSTEKYVISHTPMTPSWEHTLSVSSHIGDFIRTLKDRSGKDIGIFGSSALASSLLSEHYIDEFRLMINPVVLGEGTPFLTEKHSFSLVSTRVFSSGNTLCVYR